MLHDYNNENHINIIHNYYKKYLSYYNINAKKSIGLLEIYQ